MVAVISLPRLSISLARNADLVDENIFTAQQAATATMIAYRKLTLPALLVGISFLGCPFDSLYIAASRAAPR